MAMEQARIVRAAETVVLAGVSALLLSACGETIAGDLEYNQDGTATRSYYERINNGPDAPAGQGAVKSTRTYECTENDNGSRLVHTIDMDIDGEVLAEAIRPSRACRDMEITDPEQP